MTKEDNECFKNSTKCCIIDNDYIDNDVKVRDHCHITGRYRGSAHRDCNINLKLNHKIPIVSHNLKIYDFHLIMQEIGKFNLKTNVLNKDGFKYLSQVFHNNVLDLVKQKGFYPYYCMAYFKKFKEQLPSKDRKTGNKVYELVLNVWNKSKMKKMKNYHQLYLKCDALLLADVFEKFRNNILKNYGLCPNHY